MQWSDGLEPAGIDRLLSVTTVHPSTLALAAWFLWSLVVACVLTWWVRRYALRHALVDQPGERRSHAVPTPRGGGLSIVVVMLLAIAWLGWSDPSQVPWLAAIGIGLVLVAGIGWLDDHRPLSPWLRLAVHAIAAALLAFAVHRAGGSAWLVLASFALALVLVNVWNFMDGIDGLAASQAGIVAIGFALLVGSGPAMWLALALAGGCCGFLPFNLPRAKIFLGDVGSGSLGYVLAALTAMLASEALSWPLLLLPMSAFLVDATLTLFARMVRGERWWAPHVSHAYQRWARKLGRHWPVTLAYAVWGVFTILAMFVLLDRAKPFIMPSVIATYLAGSLAWFRLQSMGPRIAGEGRE